MRVGVNPNKFKDVNDGGYLHQVIIPVYVPNQEGYFKDAFQVLKVCLDSLFKTINSKTFITIVNNGCSETVVKFLNVLFLENKIHELIHTDNIGKINAVLKGLTGHKFKLITIADSDVFFLPNWQNATYNVFNAFPKAGVVGLTPQIKMYKSKSSNVIAENIFKSRISFMPILDTDAFKNFYESIGWGNGYSDIHNKMGLGIKIKGVNCFIGSGHYVATYRAELFDNIDTFIGGKKVAGIGEDYIDNKALFNGLWRLTTQQNYAFHMGNTISSFIDNKLMKESNEVPTNDNKSINAINSIRFTLSNNLISYKFTQFILKRKRVERYFLSKLCKDKAMLNEFLR